jgi:hypothetical protein
MKLPRSFVGIFDDNGKKTVVRVVYSDESGTGSVEEEPILVVTAIVLNMDSQWRPVEMELNALAPKQNSEFKGAKLFRDLKNGRKRAQADAILRGVLSIPVKYHIPIVYSALDRVEFRRLTAGKPKAAKDYQIGFFICADLIDIMLHTFFPTERVLWISDHSERNEGRLKQVHNLAKGFQQLVGTSPFKELFPQKTAHVSPMVDTVYFGNSHESRALQLADVCCSVIVRHLRGMAIAKPYYELVESRVINGPVKIYFRDKD